MYIYIYVYINISASSIHTEESDIIIIIIIGHFLKSVYQSSRRGAQWVNNKQVGGERDG